MPQVEHKKLTRTPESKEALGAILNQATNPIACSYYASGKLCTSESVTKRAEEWGKRAEENPDGPCAHIIFVDNNPTAFINIGLPGTPPTAIDKSHPDKEGKVLEFGFMVADNCFQNLECLNLVARITVQILKTHKANGYTKAFGTFNPANPYAPNFWKVAGGKELNCNNIEQEFGHNAFHPQRVKCENNVLLWNGDWEKIKFESSTITPEPEAQEWYDLPKCTNWIEKGVAVINVNPSGDLSVNDEGY